VPRLGGHDGHEELDVLLDSGTRKEGKRVAGGTLRQFRCERQTYPETNSKSDYN